MAATFLTPNRHGYSVRFSPFNPSRLVVATSQYYGLTGGGTLFVLEITPDGKLINVEKREWLDGLFDVVWSENSPNIVVSASGDGSLQVWNLSNTVPEQLGNVSNNVISTPLLVLKEHKKEIYSVDWSRTRTEQLVLSASWDCTIKLWDPTRAQSLNTYLGHTQLVYNAMWSPHLPNCFASVSGDGYLKLWNSTMVQKPTISTKVHDAEVLSCDWCKYDQNILATAGSDGLIRGWDIRNMNQPFFEQKGCEYAVRRIQFSPHCLSILASVNYDFTTRIWDFKKGSEAIEIIKHHSEFVYGLDWNIHRQGQIADCGWDSLVHVYSPKCLLNC